MRLSALQQELEIAAGMILSALQRELEIAAGMRLSALQRELEIAAGMRLNIPDPEGQGVAGIADSGAGRAGGQSTGRHEYSPDASTPKLMV
jgi:hypothetical protein